MVSAALIHRSATVAQSPTTTVPVLQPNPDPSQSSDLEDSGSRQGQVVHVFHVRKLTLWVD